MSNAVNAENVMRKKNTKKRIFSAIILLAILLFIEMGLAYNYLSVMMDKESMGVNVLDFIQSTMYLFRSFNLPLNLDTIKSIFRCIGAAWPANLMIIFALLIAIRKQDKFKGMEHGSARWATRAEMKKYDKSSPFGYLPVAHQVMIDPQDNNLPNINEIVLGGSGTGKSFTKLIPDIMCQFGSYIITDVKGDLYKFLNKILTKSGYKVRVLNLSDLRYSNTFNPILYCENDTDIDKLVNTFVINSRRQGASTGEGFWEDTLSMLLFAAIKYIVTTPQEEKTFYRCLQLAASIKTINGEVDPTCEIERVMSELELKDPYNSAVLNWNLVKQAPPETLASVVISLTSRLRLWANEYLRILTQTDEMDFKSVAKEKTAIFLIVSEGDSTYRSISSMFISTAVQTLKNYAKNECQGRLPRPVSFELDEFANTGTLPQWDETVSTIRSQNIRAMMIIQDQQQLQKNYKDSYKTIQSNCAIFNYLGTTDPETIKMISTRLGKTTITETRVSSQVGATGRGRDSVSENGLGRDLMTVSEVEHKKREKSIVFLDGEYPMYVDKYHTADHPLFSMLGNNSGPHSKNNTDIATMYKDLYLKHKADYEDFRRLQKARNSPSLFDSGDQRSHNLVNSELKAQSETPDFISGDSSEERLEQEFNRQFLDDLKLMNQ